MKRLTIVVDGRELQTLGSTGIGRYLQNFLESEVCKTTRHQIVVVGDVHTPSGGLHATTDFCRITGLPGRLWDQVSLPRKLRSLAADVFLSPYDKAPFRAPCPIVATFHDLLFLRISHLPRLFRSVYGLGYSIERRWLSRRLSAILTVSDCSRKELIRVLRMPARKIRITHNGIAKRFRPITSAGELARVRSRHKLEEGSILYVGNYKPHKNVGALIEAFVRLPEVLRQQHPLILAGHLGDHGIRLKTGVEGRGIRNVRFIGPIADSDLPALYSGATLFAYPSLEEGFGMPPLEAMACGIPVIASNASSLPEVLGSAAVMVDSADTGALSAAIETLLADRTLRARRSRSGLEQAALFTVERTASRIIRALEEAAASPMSTRAA